MKEQIAKIIDRAIEHCNCGEHFDVYTYAQEMISALASTDLEGLRKQIARWLYIRDGNCADLYWDKGQSAREQEYLDKAQPLMDIIQPIITAKIEQARQEVEKELLKENVIMPKSVWELFSSYIPKDRQ